MAILASLERRVFYLNISSTFIPVLQRKKSKVTLESMNTQQGDDLNCFWRFEFHPEK